MAGSEPGRLSFDEFASPLQQFGTFDAAHSTATTDPRSNTPSASFHFALDSLNASLGNNPLMAGSFTNDIPVLGNEEGSDKTSAETNIKGFTEDLLSMPFDLSTPFPSLDLSNPIAFPLTSIASAYNPAAFNNFTSSFRDSELESPLGLNDTDNSPLSDLLASPAFGLIPSPALGPEDFHALFPSPQQSFTPASMSGAPLFNFPSLPPLPSTSADISPFLSNTSTPALSPQERSPPTLPPLSSASASRPRATGFRGASTPLLPLDAPIRPREYRVESTTSKKRKTIAIEKGLAKRGRSSSSPDGELAPIAEKQGEELPEDLVEQAERKRLQNTLSARKSRQRKQERLGQLEERNRELEERNEGLMRRVEELERIVRSIGVVV